MAVFAALGGQIHNNCIKLCIQSYHTYLSIHSTNSIEVHSMGIIVISSVSHIPIRIVITEPSVAKISRVLV